MNDAFVNVKVDREERPDLDQIYQTAHALLTRRSGGWPLTMFLTPEGAPFFGGTYFPKQGRYGLPGFLDLLPKVAAAYREQGDRLAEQNRRLAEALQSLEPEGGGAPSLATRIGGRARGRSSAASIRVHGGFGARAQVPAPVRARRSACARTRATATPKRSRSCAPRSTAWRTAASTISWAAASAATPSTREWTIPHFEKMLYDNGPLLALYADARARHRRAALRGCRARHRRLARARDARATTARSTRASTPTAKARKASSTCGRARKRARRSPTRSGPSPSRTYGLDGPPNFEGHAWNLRVARAARATSRSGSASTLPDAQTRLARRARRLVRRAREARAARAATTRS